MYTALAPAMTESYKLLQPLLTAAFDMAQLPHFRTAATVQAKAPEIGQRARCNCF